MSFLIKLIILLQIYGCIQISKAYVLQTPQQTHDENNDLVSENKLSAQGVTKPSSIYIGNMVNPSEIREPSSLQEIVNYVGAEKLTNADVKPELENSEHTLTYTELTQLLAFWQWAKEQNFYEMQTDQPNTSDNFITEA